MAATDGGSTGQFADFVNNSDRQLDFAYRAYPATHDNAIPLIEAFYGRAPTKSYFVGCSEGGREALLMAQRYPTYFDGIQAGSPAKYPSHMWIGNNIWLDQLFANPNNRLSVPQINLIQNSPPPLAPPQAPAWSPIHANATGMSARYCARPATRRTAVPA